MMKTEPVSNDYLNQVVQEQAQVEQQLRRQTPLSPAPGKPRAKRVLAPADQPGSVDYVDSATSVVGAPTKAANPLKLDAVGPDMTSEAGGGCGSGCGCGSEGGHTHAHASTKKEGGDAFEV